MGHKTGARHGEEENSETFLVGDRTNREQGPEERRALKDEDFVEPNTGYQAA